MGIVVEFNPDLALREYVEFKNGNRKKEECVPEKIEEGKVYDFLKKDQRNYWFFGEIPLVKTKGNQSLSRPIASIQIIEATHFIEGENIFTRGKYKIVKKLDNDEPYFECFDLGSRKEF